MTATDEMDFDSIGKEKTAVFLIIPAARQTYKAIANIFYSQWDEMQDKKLIKYALQTILLCDNYQAKIENGEWLDEESFSSFKSKGEALINKMEKYLGDSD